jgi:hypothetical protein
MSDEWTPPGYVSAVSLVREHGVDKVRSDLFSRRHDAFQWDGTAGQLYPIEPTAWCADTAKRWLERGWLPHRIAELPPCWIVVRMEAGAQPQPPPDGAYETPYMQLMRHAVRRFEISGEHWPKKEVLEEHFRAQKLPDGTPISANLASQLATLCRPLAAQRGGNKKG